MGEIKVVDNRTNKESVSGRVESVRRVKYLAAVSPAQVAVLLDTGYEIFLPLELIDELAFYDDGEYVYEQILQPRTYTTKGQIIVFTNPNGQQGICWKMWNDPMFHRYKFNFLDCPTMTLNPLSLMLSDCAGPCTP